MPSATNVERTHRTCFSELLTSVKLHAPLISPQIINTPPGVGGQNAQRQHRCWSQLPLHAGFAVFRRGRLTAKYLFHIKKHQVTFWSNSICQMPVPAKRGSQLQLNTQLIPNGSHNGPRQTRDGLQRKEPPPSSINCFRNWKENI